MCSCNNQKYNSLVEMSPTDWNSYCPGINKEIQNCYNNGNVGNKFLPCCETACENLNCGNCDTCSDIPASPYSQPYSDENGCNPPCNPNENCIDNKCIKVPGTMCNSDNDCKSNEMCMSDNRCASRGNIPSKPTNVSKNCDSRGQLTQSLNNFVKNYSDTNPSIKASSTNCVGCRILNKTSGMGADMFLNNIDENGNIQDDGIKGAITEYFEECEGSSNGGDKGNKGDNGNKGGNNSDNGIDIGHASSSLPIWEIVGISIGVILIIIAIISYMKYKK